MRPLDPLTPWVYRALDLWEHGWGHDRSATLAHALVAWASLRGAEPSWLAAVTEALESPGEPLAAARALEAGLPAAAPPPAKVADWEEAHLAGLLDGPASAAEALMRHVELRREACLPRVPPPSDPAGLHARAFAASALFCHSMRGGDVRLANAGLKVVDTLRAAALVANARRPGDPAPALALATALACQERALAGLEGR